MHCKDLREICGAESVSAGVTVFICSEDQSYTEIRFSQHEDQQLGRIIELSDCVGSRAADDFL